MKMPFSIAFAAIVAFFAASAPAATDGTWTVETLPASDATMLQTAGTPLYAYRGASSAMTRGDVTFQAGADLSGANIAFDPAFTEANANAGGSSLLGTAWNFGASQSMAEIRLTLSGLTSGHEYLVQILARNAWGNPYITIGDLPRVNIQSGNGSSGATVYGTIQAVGSSHDVVFKMGGSGAARYVAAVQVRDLGAAAPSVVDPSIESASVSVTEATATVSLGGIVLGTDAQGAAATSYDVSYSLTNAPAVVALNDQTGATASFNIANLADGEYTCAVTVETDAGKTASTNLVFRVGEAPVAPWTVSPMGPDETSILTNGTLVYAYATLDQNQPVHDVSFRRGASSDALAENISVTPSFSGHIEGMGHVDWTNYGWLLKRALYWSSSVSETTMTLRLKNLVSGHNYLVQIVSFSSRSEEAGMMISVNGTPPQHIGPNGSDTTYQYGASIVGTFSATDATEDVAVTYSGNATGYRPINAIQVRELPADGPVSSRGFYFICK